jgi:hypothetical protein
VEAWNHILFNASFVEACTPQKPMVCKFMSLMRRLTRGSLDLVCHPDMNHDESKTQLILVDEHDQPVV